MTLGQVCSVVVLSTRCQGWSSTNPFLLTSGFDHGFEQQAQIHFNQVWCRAGWLMYSDAVIVDTITDDFTIEQYASTVESCGFDLH